jgi:hypothetical protein
MHRVRPKCVFLQSEGALVTSRWVAIGDHTFATEEVTSAFVRKSRQGVAGFVLSALGFALALVDSPIALAVIGLAIYIALAGALHPSVELVVLSEDAENVVAQAGNKSVSSVSIARLREIHAALLRAVAVHSGNFRPAFVD